jgi:hypothetical protein
MQGRYKQYLLGVSELIYVSLLTMQHFPPAPPTGSNSEVAKITYSLW